MKKLLSVALLLSSFAFAETVNLNSGWNLVGSSNSVDVSQITNPDVKIIWRWHNNQWQAYTNDSDISSLLSQYNITQFTITDPNEGFWVFSVAPTSIDLSTNTSTTDTTYDVNQSYPIVDYLGKMYDLDWSKMVATYPGDTRYQDGNVTLDFQNNDIDLLALRKPGEDSRAGAVTQLNNASGVEADVNLITDNVDSKFQLWAMAKNITISETGGSLTTTENLEFYVFVTVNKHGVYVSWEIWNPENDNSWFQSVQSYYDANVDLTNLTNTSDIHIKIYADNGTIYYTVTNLANNTDLLNGSFNISGIVTNFDGFDYSMVRSRVDDDDNTAQIDESYNIVNNFSVIGGTTTAQITSADDFLNSLNFTPVTISSSDFSGKTFVSHDYDDNVNAEFDVFSDNGLTWTKYNDDGQVVDSGSETWSIYNNNVLIISDENNQVETYVAVGDIKNNTYYIGGYDLQDGDTFYDKVIRLDAPVNFGTVIDEANLKSWFANTTFVDSIDSALLDKKWAFGENETITFDSANGTVTHTETNEDGTISTDEGGFYVTNDGIIKCEFENNYVVYILPYNLTDSNLDAYVVFGYSNNDSVYLNDVDEINAVPAQ